MKMEFSSPKTKSVVELVKNEWCAGIIVNGIKIGIIDLYPITIGKSYFNLIVDDPDHDNMVMKLQFDERGKVTVCVDGESSQYVGVCDHPATLHSDPGDWVFTFPRSKESEE